MIGRLAIRSLTAHPVRSAVLAAGFGFGVAVMAILLGVAQIVLEQSRAPALVGGGDVLIRLSDQVPGRLVMAGALQSAALRSRIRTAAPTHTAPLFLLHNGRATRVQSAAGSRVRPRARQPETSAIAEWVDSPRTSVDPNTRTKCCGMSIGFIRCPALPSGRGHRRSGYFNGRAPNARFYLTFMVGPATAGAPGHRSASVRLQLDRGGEMQNFTATASITEADALEAPDLRIGELRPARGMRYSQRRSRGRARTARSRGSDARRIGHPAHAPFEITGARGWRSGYVVPVMSGRLGGTLDVDNRRIDFNDGAATTITTGVLAGVCRGAGDSCSMTICPCSMAVSSRHPTLQTPRIPGLLEASSARKGRSATPPISASPRQTTIAAIRARS